MAAFLKEYWLWILVPFLIVVGGIGLLWFVGAGASDAGDFIYNVM